ncbi:hypothetical protein [Lacicoccus qingdaonensis]|uniref:Uncharacterized protein n=1 Tax=Lacicoccus qingdaonensis TaxID=576118 RepID=A0A1G9E5G1_9BACL|nr:hypothetical protein [Salinicoccus qingdaonensis]SDK71354.1 hypothetical protein SAMN05216216_107103 [Salinicoccus qingdaonensis]
MLSEEQEKSLNTYLNWTPFIGLVISIVTAVFLLVIMDYSLNDDIVIYILMPFLAHVFLIYLPVKMVSKL